MGGDRQVEAGHYAFGRYMSQERWASVWHQLDEVLRLGPASVLEVGPGNGLFKRAAGAFGVEVETLDMDAALEPDHVASALALPFDDRAFDVACAFQMLEHLPYEDSLKAFAELSRVAARAVVISLPDARRVWRYSGWIPKLGQKSFAVPRPFSPPQAHAFDGQHYWEIGKRGYDLARVRADLARIRPLVRTYRAEHNPYHRFFVFEGHHRKGTE